MNKYEALGELLRWLKSERYLIDNKSDTMTDEYEKEHKCEIITNAMIDKTIAKVIELAFEE